MIPFPFVYCHRCEREFKSHRALAQHLGWVWRLRNQKAARDRVCPDRRSHEQAREETLRIVSLKARLGLLRHV